MEKIVNSPFSGLASELRTERVILPYKGHRYEVVRSFYHCKISGEDFTSPEQHDLVIHQLRKSHAEHTFANVALGSQKSVPHLSGVVGDYTIPYPLPSLNYQPHSRMELAE